MIELLELVCLVSLVIICALGVLLHKARHKPVQVITIPGKLRKRVVHIKDSRVRRLKFLNKQLVDENNRLRYRLKAKKGV